MLMPAFRNPFEGLSEPELTMAQFGQRTGTRMDLLAHWSVERGDPNPDKPANRQAFARHLKRCRPCRDIEAERG
jgi:hypothetical protein